MLAKPETPDCARAAAGFPEDRGQAGPWQRAAADLRASWRLRKFCLALAWHDLRLRYQGSVLGPFWVTLSTAIAVGLLGGLYARLFGVTAVAHLPYLAVSLVLWNALAGLVGEACHVFTQQAGMIRSVRMPYGVHVARLLLRALCAVAHAALVLPVVFWACGVVPGWGVLMAVPAALWWLCVGFCVALGLGTVAARFRDVPPALAGVSQLGLFVTPVLWRAELLGDAAWLALLNPCHALLEILRAPLLGEMASATAWAVALAGGGVAAALGLAGFVWGRARLPIWA